MPSTQTHLLAKTLLNRRFPDVLSLVIQREQGTLTSGLEPLDSLLNGGLPSGSITELVGANCSGRITTALTYLAAHTVTGNVCAWVDVADALDPESVAANGVDLERLLWVRCGAQQRQMAQDTPEALQSVLDTIPIPSTALPRHTGGGSPHPRSEGRDMPEAIGMMLRAHGGLYDKEARRQKRGIGTPGAPNRPITMRSEDREEQINSDRLPPRRGQNLALAPRCAEPQPRRTPQQPSGERMEYATTKQVTMQTANSQPWQAIDHALRATDLLLQGGGFSTIVLDLGSVPPEVVWRIPLATWFRFRAACERTRVSVLLLTQHSCARSSAGLVVRLQTGTMTTDSRVMKGIRYRGGAERFRAASSEGGLDLARKPPQSDRMGEWFSEAAWAQTK